jgi:hypothetical protein
MDKIQETKNFLKDLRIKTAIPFAVSAILLIITFILIWSGMAILIIVNFVFIISSGISFLRWNQYRKSIERFERVLYHDNPLQELLERQKNMKAPNNNPSHDGIVDDYYNQPSRFMGILGDTDLIVIDKVVERLQ